ncbi:MAG: tetratricopeptide repeat protein [Ignavibacteriae bacterium]|nr:tetratricopeptide repeat protein [Ignavibacteriota bacterium]
MKLNKVLTYTGIVALLCYSVVIAQKSQHHKSSKIEIIGKVHFPISGNSLAQDQFNRGMALLHSFWYEEAGKTFASITNMDPSCAMAYWGLATSYYHPLWEPPDAATLKKGWEAIQQAKSIGTKTDRERDYFEAIEAFYKDADKLDHRTRALAYEKALEQLYLLYPDDQEAAVLYALELVATALPTDKSYTNQKKASDILNKVLKDQPDHPGVAHYIIHSNDYPALASRGLDAARKYSKIAPSVPHALHMPSHIFTRLGLWDESIESNRASETAAKNYAAQNFKDTTWDQELHAKDYLMYAYLQRGEDNKAKGVQDELMKIKVSKPENLVASYALATIPARYAVERRKWSEAASLTLYPNDFAWTRFPFPLAIHYFARVLGATRNGDTTGVEAYVGKIASFRAMLIEKKQNYWADQVEILHREAAAWLAYTQGKKADAISLMRSAVELEDSTEKHPITPGPIVPAHELMGELLLELNQPAEALREFETSLQSSPNRFNGLYSAARAAKLMGNNDQAKTYFEKLVELCKQADGDRNELKEAKEFLAGK